MNFTLTSKVKSLLSYLVPVAMVSPSLIWIALDKSVWMWDEAIYGKDSVELFYMLSHSPKRWLRLIFNILHEQALEYPGWVNFLYRWVTYGLNRHGIVGIDYTDTGSHTPAHVPRCDLSARNELVAITGCLVIASAPLFVAMSHQYLTEPLQLLAVGWFVLIMSFAPKWPQLRS